MIHTTLAIVKVCRYHAPGTVARLSYGQKSHNAFQCALNTENARRKNKGFAVFRKNAAPMPEAVAKIRYFCVSSI